MKQNLKSLKSLLVILLLATISQGFSDEPSGKSDNVKDNEVKVGNQTIAIRFGVESQKPEDSFESGKLPKALERMANQFHEVVNYTSTILANVDHLQNTVPVAIIDTGVDLAHPDLVSRIRYKIEDNKIAGSGLDAMGGDAYASANLVSVRLFSFGAESIKGGKIVNPKESPLEHLEKLNQEFLAKFLTALNAHPVLKDSMFAKKLNAKNFTLLGAHLFLINNDFDTMRYNAFKNAGLLIDENIRKNFTQPSYKNKIHPIDIHYVVDQEWKLDPNTGLPFLPTINDSPFARAMLKIEHAEEFYDLLGNTLNDFIAKSDYQRSLGTFLQFSGPREFSVTTPVNVRLNSAILYLAKAHYYHVHGPQSVDPLVDILKNLEQFVVLSKSFNGNLLNAPLTISKQKLSDAMQVVLGIQAAFMDYFVSFPMRSSIEEALFKKLHTKFESVTALISWYFFDRTGLVKYKADESGVPLQPMWDNRYRKFLHRSQHPYLGSDHAQSHGTHVAGIVAVQDSKLSIEPVRVGLGEVAVNPLEVSRLSLQFRKNFKEFLTHPVIFRAIASELSDHSDDLNFKDESLENRTILTEYLMQVLEGQINILTEVAPSYFSFLVEIKKAIRHVAAQKIPVANLSLGGEYGDRIRRASVAKGGVPNLERDIESLFGRLVEEYHKFVIANEVKKAPNTIFVFAAGNSGRWIDGDSRGASPADLSSAFLAKFERPAVGEVIVNNTLDNVIAVGSWSSKDRPSSYSNLLLGSRTPLVFIEGEHVLSSVRTVDPTSAIQAIDDRLPELGIIARLGPFDRRYQNFWNQLFLSMGAQFDFNDPDQVMAAEQFFKVTQKILMSLTSATAIHLFAEFPDARARFSGTSMAAPAAAGLIGKRILQKANERGVSLKDIYGHPEFSPRTIIKEVMSRGQKTLVAGNHQVIKLHGERFYENTASRNSLDNFLSGLINDPQAFWTKAVQPLLPNPLVSFALTDPNSKVVDIANPNSGPMMSLFRMQSRLFASCEMRFGLPNRR